MEAGHFCACHLYNSEQDTQRLLEQAEINDAEEKLLAEKEAKKPWNVVKTKVVTTAKNIFKKKENKEEGAELAETVGEVEATAEETAENQPPETENAAGGEVAEPARLSDTPKAEEPSATEAEKEQEKPKQTKKPATRSKKKTDGEKE